MNTKRFVVSGAGVLALGLLFSQSAVLPQGGLMAASPQAAVTASTAATPDAAAQRQVLDQFCSGCHGQKAKAAKIDSAVRLTLDDLDLTKVRDHADKWDKVVRKLRAGLMPPPNSRRPDPSTMNSLITCIEGEHDRHAVTRKLGAVKTSMLQDVEGGRAIELDSIVGAVHELGQRVGVQAPNVAALLGLARLFGRMRGLYPDEARAP